MVHDLVTGLTPRDRLEAEHRSAVLRWLESTDDVFRRAKPAEPPQHLVSYVVSVDPTDGSSLRPAFLTVTPIVGAAAGHTDAADHRLGRLLGL